MVTGQILMFSTQHPWLRPRLSISGSVKLFLLLKGNWHLREILTSFVQMESASQKAQKHVELLHSYQRQLFCLFTDIKMACSLQGMCVTGWLCDTSSFLFGYWNWLPLGLFSSISLNIQLSGNISQGNSFFSYPSGKRGTQVLSLKYKSLAE